MKHRTITFLSALALGIAPALFAQSPAPAPQQPAPSTAPDQHRDLTFKREGPAPAATTTVQIPRSYALVIGISKYKNLPQDAQLQYPDMDAESIYTVLISPEGGQFPAENVHKLIDSQATLANIQHELETWLPSVTHPDDRVVSTSPATASSPMAPPTSPPMTST